MDHFSLHFTSLFTSLHFFTHNWLGGVVPWTLPTTSGVGGRQRRVREAGALTGYGAPAVSTPGLGSCASRARPGGGWAQRLRCTGCQHCGSGLARFARSPSGLKKILTPKTIGILFKTKSKKLKFCMKNWKPSYLWGFWKKIPTPNFNKLLNP